MINIKNLNPNKIYIDEKTFFITFGMLRSKILTLEKLWKLYFERIDVSEGIDVNKPSASKERIVWHYHYFLDKGFKFQLDILSGYLWILAILLFQTLMVLIIVVLLTELATVKL